MHNKKRNISGLQVLFAITRKCALLNTRNCENPSWSIWCYFKSKLILFLCMSVMRTGVFGSIRTEMPLKTHSVMRAHIYIYVFCSIKQFNKYQSMYYAVSNNSIRELIRQSECTGAYVYSRLAFASKAHFSIV